MKEATMPLSKEDFLAILTPERRQFIYECVSGGLGDYANPAYYSPEARRDHTPSVRASIRNCHIVGRAKRVLPQHTDIRIATKNNRIFFIIADMVRLSFKKFDKDLRSRNYPTKQSRDFNAQKFDGFDVEPLTNVIAGYQTNVTETQFALFITCPDEQRNLWEVYLDGEEALTFLTTPEIPEPVKERVKVRPAIKTVSDEASNG
jgi:hypothetical protein